MYAFLSVGTDDPPGPHEIRVDFSLKNGSKGTLAAEATVLATQWTFDALDFTDQQTSELLDPIVVADESALLSRMYATYTPEKLWSGAWVLPLDGALTARFGEQRSINGGPPSGHHTGTDMGVEPGTPVRATNRGRVLMVRALAMRGNMVIVDHGGGLLSGYAHLQGFAVSEGQEVQQGDVVGYAGNTGLSTGAHLHWEMAANDIGIDALRFVDGTNGF
jgi:murein DD-endopeptidase MepM/ murein hydrolase activator NlpD